MQLYDRDDFLVAGVALFAAEGLHRGDAVYLIGTRAHLEGVRRALACKGLDPEAALREGELVFSDAQQAIQAVLVDGMPDRARFDELADAALGKARADARFSGVRWWGEMSNLLHQAGNERASLLAEDLGTAAAKRHDVKLFCSFFCDRFDARGYDGMLRQMCGKHTHVIPAEDYVRHRLAVNRAIADVVGEIKGPLLQSLLSWNGLSCDLPSSQALLFWIREALPEHFQEVLSRARAYQLQEPA